MKRLLPNHLFGQMLLILLGGLVVSYAIGGWIYSSDREAAVRAVGGLATAQRIANLTHLVEDAPADWRPRLVASLSDQNFRVALTPQQPRLTAGEEHGAVADAIRGYLIDRLKLGSDRQPLVAAALPDGPPFGFGFRASARDDARLGRHDDDGRRLRDDARPDRTGRSARPRGRHPAQRRAMAFVQRGGDERLADLFLPVHHRHDRDGVDHRRRLDLGDAPGDGAADGARRRRPAPRPGRQRATDRGNRHASRPGRLRAPSTRCRCACAN